MMYIEQKMFKVYSSKLLAFIICMSTFVSSMVVDGKHVFCYYSSFAQTRQGVGKFLPENIDPFLCTHIIFAFVDISSDGTDLKPFNRNDQGPRGLYSRTLALKNRNPNLKVLLAVGGWQIGSKPFMPMISNEHNRKLWVKNVVKYLREHKFDGFDVDWEFPATRGSPPEDKYRYTSLMKELYEAFAQESRETGNDKLILTMATASGTYYIDQSYEPRKIIKYLDFMLLMTYNYHGQWEKMTGHHSGLYNHRDDPKWGEKSQLNQQWSIDYWLDVGISPDKLIVGIPTYGMSFTLANPSQNGVHAPASGGGRMGDYTRETGILSFYEICMSQREKGWQSVWIDDQAAPYTYHYDQWAGYDNKESIVLKAENLMKRGLAGAFVWSVEMDDFNGVCQDGKYPLLSTINRVLNGNQVKTMAASRQLENIQTKIDLSELQKPKPQYSELKSGGDDDNGVSKNRNIQLIKFKKRRRGRKQRKFRTTPKTTPAVTTTASPEEEEPAKASFTTAADPKSDSTAQTTPETISTTRESLKIKWWSGTVYRKEAAKTPSRRRFRKKLQRKYKKGKVSTKPQTTWKDITYTKATRKPVYLTKSPNAGGAKTRRTNSWWRRPSVRQVSRVTPQWTWNARPTVTEKPKLIHQVEHKEVTSRPRMSTRRRFPVTRRRNNFSKQSYEMSTKPVKTAAAGAIDCQTLGAGTFRDPSSCRRFIICMPGSWLDHPPHVMNCPVGTLFDENMNICNYASRVQCP